MGDSSVFQIYVNNKPFLTNQAHLTGTEIKQLSGIPLDYGLYILRDAESSPVHDNEAVPVEGSPQFRAIPSATMGS